MGRISFDNPKNPAYDRFLQIDFLEITQFCQREDMNAEKHNFIAIEGG